MKAASLSERDTFWLSLLFHVLLFAIYLLMLMRYPVSVPEKRPALYVPSYLSTPASSAKATEHQLSVPRERASHQTALNQSRSAYKRQQPVYMIGEKLADDPLKKLLGAAISRHLYYPQAAQELGVEGVVEVGFTIFPDGSVMNVQVVRSSHKPMLDSAAIVAVQKMEPVANVDIYLKQPKFLVVNVIFR